MKRALAITVLSSAALLSPVADSSAQASLLFQTYRNDIRLNVRGTVFFNDNAFANGDRFELNWLAPIDLNPDVLRTLGIDGISFQFDFSNIPFTQSLSFNRGDLRTSMNSVPSRLRSWSLEFVRGVGGHLMVSTDMEIYQVELNFGPSVTFGFNGDSFSADGFFGPYLLTEEMVFGRVGNAIPTPATTAIFGAGLLGLFAARRGMRRRNV